MFDVSELLTRFIETPGGSGDEHRVAKELIGVASPYCQTITTDPLGSVILYRQGEGHDRPRVMIAAHMDEITLIVSAIEKGGFLRVSEVGGFDPRTLPGQEVVVHGRQELIGIVGSKPPHLSSAQERKKSAPLEDLFIDLAMSEATVREMVRVGDRITMNRTCIPLLGDRRAGKAMDNRASMTAMVTCLHELSHMRIQADVYAVGTVQEEVGCYGAQTAAFGIAPDLAIALDVCHGETPGVADDLVKQIGGGPVISFGPHIHPVLFERLCEVAKEQGIAVQVEVGQGPTWTDGDPIQISQAGVPTAVISIPLRYMHTSVETLSTEDIRHVGMLLARFLGSVDKAFVEGLTCYLKN